MNRIASIIGVITLLLGPGLASATNGFLSENSRQGKNLGQAEIHREIATLNAESQRVCDDSCFEHAADSVVAPKNAVSCFPPGTPVSTQTGFKPIQSVKAGDLVWGYDPDCRSWSLRQVVETYVHKFVGDIVSLTVADDVIEATSNHPFWVVEGDGLDGRDRPEHIPETPPKTRTPGRWVDAGSLRVGDVLLLRSDRWLSITRIAVRSAAETVYNFQVEGVHTYAVGACEALVHNKPAANRLPIREGASKIQVEELLEAEGMQIKRIGGLERPAIDDVTKAAIEGNAKRNAAGQFIDKNGNVIKEPTYGHLPGYENRRIIEAGEKLGLNQEQLKQFVNAHPDYFFIEEKSVNLSHVNEIPGKGDLGKIIADMEKFFGL